MTEFLISPDTLDALKGRRDELGTMIDVGLEYGAGVADITAIDSALARVIRSATFGPRLVTVEIQHSDQIVLSVQLEEMAGWHDQSPRIARKLAQTSDVLHRHWMRGKEVAV